MAMGSFIAMIFTVGRKAPNCIWWLRWMFPGKDPIWYRRRDFVLTWVSGVVVAYFAFAPTNDLQAFTAGVGSVSAIRMLLGKYQDDA
jgi:hypothetical protein